MGVDDVYSDGSEPFSEFLNDFLDSKSWTTVVTTVTFMALFQADVATMYYGRGSDAPLAVITMTIFLIFFFEMVLNLALSREYGAQKGWGKFTTFFGVLDMIATFSLIPDFVIIFGIEFDGKYALPRAVLLPGTPTASPPAPTPSRRALQSECAVARQEPIEAPQLQEVWRARRQRSRALDEHDVCARRPVQDAFQARDAPLLRRAHHGYQGRRAQVQDHAHRLWRLRRDHGGVEVRESALTRALRGVSLRADRNTGEQFSESHPR